MSGVTGFCGTFDCQHSRAFNPFSLEADDAHVSNRDPSQRECVFFPLRGNSTHRPGFKWDSIPGPFTLDVRMTEDHLKCTGFLLTQRHIL